MLDQEFKNKARKERCPLSEDEITAQIENSDCLRFPSSILRRRYPAFWQENIALTPEEVKKILTADLPGKTKIMEITRGESPQSLRVSGTIYALDGRETGFAKMMDGPKIQDDGRDMDLETGTMHPGYIHTKNMQGGRLFLRNEFELGYALGCNKARIKAAMVGSWLWTKGFNVESVTPEYMNHLRNVYDTLKNNIDDETVKRAVEEALEQEDMQALAAIDYDMRDRMPGAAATARCFNELRSTITREDRLSLSKVMMIKHSDGNWIGTADLNNPRDCARLGQCLGGWNNPELKARAAQYEQTAQPAAKARPAVP